MARRLQHTAPAGKFVIAINEDIDPTNADALLWAMSYRANANLDMHVLPHRDTGPRSAKSSQWREDASVLIDATLKEDFPPISLPKREYMERAKVIWEELGLPKLKPETPWFRLFARRMVAGVRRRGAPRDARRLSRQRQGLEQRRRKDVRMNTKSAESPEGEDEKIAARRVACSPRHPSKIQAWP